MTKPNLTHSPGPWAVAIKGSYVGVVAPPNKDYPNGHVVAQVCRGPGKNTVDNAHILAASTDLLAALKGLLVSTAPGAYAKARAAIAKAQPPTQEVRI